MATYGTNIIRGIATESIVDRLDSLYAYEILAMNWALVVRTRLQGQAVYGIPEELENLVDASLNRARALSKRAAQLQGSVSLDLATSIERSPAEHSRWPSDLSSPADVLGYAIEQVRKAIPAYAEAIDAVRGKDDVTHQLLVKMLEEQVELEDDLEAVLEKPALVL